MSTSPSNSNVSSLSNEYNDQKRIDLLNTIDNNKSLYSSSQISKANKARKLQQELGWLGTQQLKQLIKSNFLVNCNVTVDDVDRAVSIYGIPTPLLQGRTVTPKQTSHRAGYMSFPGEIYHNNKQLHLFTDVCYVKKKWPS